MPRDEDKIIRLDQRREQKADARRAEAKARRDADRRRKLAEHGPGATRYGRMIGQGLALLILAAALISLAAWIWSLAT